MKLLLDGKQRSIYFRKDNIAYYKIKKKEYEVSKEVLKKNKKLIKGGSLNHTFNNTDLLANIEIKQINDKVWNTATIIEVYKKLLYVFILCKIVFENTDDLFSKSLDATAKSINTDIITRILRIVLGCTYDLDVTNEKIRIAHPISLIEEGYNKKDLKDTIKKITYTAIAKSINALKDFKSQYNDDKKLDIQYNAVTKNEQPLHYNLDFLKYIMINEGLFKTQEELNDEFNPEKIKERYLAIFKVPIIDRTAVSDKSIYDALLINVNIDIDTDILTLIVNGHPPSDLQSKISERQYNAIKYIKKLERVKGLIQSYLSDSDKQKLELNNIKAIKKTYFTEHKEVYYLSQTYNNLIDYLLNDIEENIGAKLRTYISFRVAPTNIIITTPDAEKEKAKFNIKVGGTDYGNHTGIFATDKIIEGTITKNADTNEEKFARMKPLLEKLTKENLAILIFGYGYSGSGKTYTLFGNKKTETKGITQLAIDFFKSQGSTVEIDKVYELYNDEYDFDEVINKRDPYKNSKSIYIYNLPTLKFDEIPKSFTEFQHYYNNKTDIIPITTSNDFQEKLNIIDEKRKEGVKTYTTNNPTLARSSYKKTTCRIMATANNPQSSRSHLFISLKIKKSNIVSYLTICDMGGRENPNNLLLETKIYNILSVNDKPKKKKPTNDPRFVVPIPHIISKDKESMYKFDGEGYTFDKVDEVAKKKKLTAEIKKLTEDAEAAKAAATDATRRADVAERKKNKANNERTRREEEEHKIIKLEKQQLAEKADANLKSEERKLELLKKKEIIKNEIDTVFVTDTRNDQYPGLLQSFKSFYARPTIQELFRDEEDFNLFQSSDISTDTRLINEYKDLGNKISSEITANNRLPFKLNNILVEGVSVVKNRPLSQFMSSQVNIVRAFIMLFFKSIKQGFFINDTINQLLKKFLNTKPITRLTTPVKNIIVQSDSNVGTAKLSYDKKPESTKTLVNVCVIDKLNEVSVTTVLSPDYNDLGDDKARANNAEWNTGTYGWHINSLPVNCINNDIYETLDGGNLVKNLIISKTIETNTYFQYDPEIITPVSEIITPVSEISSTTTVKDHCVCLSRILENFCPEGYTTKYVVIGCLRSNPVFTDDDTATLNFLKAVSDSDMTNQRDQPNL